MCWVFFVDVCVCLFIFYFLVGFTVVYHIKFNWWGKELNRTAASLTEIMRKLATERTSEYHYLCSVVGCFLKGAP